MGPYARTGWGVGAVSHGLIAQCRQPRHWLHNRQMCVPDPAVDWEMTVQQQPLGGEPEILK